MLWTNPIKDFSGFMERVKIELKYLPTTVGINLRLAKNDLADKVDKKKEETKDNNAEKNKNSVTDWSSLKEIQKKLEDYLAVPTLGSVDIIAYRVIDLQVEKNDMWSNLNANVLARISGNERVEHWMSLLEVIDKKGDVYYFYNNKVKCTEWSCRYWLPCVELRYMPDEVAKVADALEMIVPRLETESYFISLDSPKYADWDYNKRKNPFKVKPYKLRKDKGRFVTSSKVLELDSHILSELLQIYDTWNEKSYAHILERETYDFWKRQFDNLQKVLEEARLKRNSILKRTEREQVKKAGIAGEQDVEYALKWLPEEYYTVERNEEGIVLKYADLIDEQQEIDHIVLSPKGVFLIETKNLSGSITIDAQGNWIRKKTDGTVVGERNPIQQISRHHRLLEHILGIKDIFDVICLANIGSIIQGSENSPVQIVKVDMLAYYISGYKNDSGNIYDAVTIESWKEKIEASRVKETQDSI